MGWVYSFHSLDPAVINEISSQTTAQLRDRLIRKGISPEQVGVETWSDDLDENEALILLASTRDWDIDKSLDDIQAIASLDPSLSPVLAALGQMEDFAAAQLPERFHPRESGLMGIAITPTLVAAASAVRPFIAPDARQTLVAGKTSLLQRLLGGGVRGRLASNDDLWRHWTDFGRALVHASDRGEWLGLHMS